MDVFSQRNELDIEGIPGDHGLDELWQKFDVTDGALHERMIEEANTLSPVTNGHPKNRPWDLRHVEELVTCIPSVTGYRVRPEERQAVEHRLLSDEGVQVMLLRTDVRCKAYMDIAYGVIGWLGGAFAAVNTIQKCPQLQQWQPLILSTLGSITYALTSLCHRYQTREQQKEISERMERMQQYWNNHPVRDIAEVLQAFHVEPGPVGVNGEVPKKSFLLRRSIPIFIEAVQTAVSLLTGLRF